jgi:hypothetical protein
MGAGVATAGIEYYLPLFFDETATVFDYLGPAATIVLHGDLEAAVRAAGREPVVGVLRSARLAPARIVSGAEGGLSIIAADFGAMPLVEADPSEGFSLAIYPDLGGDTGTDVWLAGLWLAGRLDLGMVRGEADLRWCTLGNPGEVALRGQVEELRVSLFAQELRTPAPVSIKRLQKAWEELQ